MQHWNSPSMGEPLLREGVPGLDGRQKIKKVEKEVYALWLYTPEKDRYVGSPIWTFPYFSFSCKKLFWKKTRQNCVFLLFFVFVGLCVHYTRPQWH
jgi:hypothetical protein